MQNTALREQDAPSEPSEPPSRLRAQTSHKPAWWQRFGRKNKQDALSELLDEQSTTERQLDGITQEERMLLANIHALRSRSVGDIKIPRADIIFVDIHNSQKQLLELIREHGHSRMPVVDRDLDEVKGMLHVKDLLLRNTLDGGLIEQPQEAQAGNNAQNNMQWHSYLRKILYVVPNLPVMDLLKEMRHKKIHMALVADEYGGIDGLVTIEDLVEQIIGDISDEHDAEDEPMIKRINDNTFEFDARFEIKDFERLFGEIQTQEEREEDIDTLGGLVSWLKGAIPTRGQIIKHDASALQFSVLQADLRRVKLLRVTNLKVKDAAFLATLTEREQ